MPENPSNIGQRLRDFGLARFSTLAEFARALRLLPQNLTPYLNGNRVPGNKIQNRLRQLGCDIEWLMTGGKKDQANDPITDEEHKMLALLKSERVDTVAKLASFLDREAIAQDVAIVVAEKLKQYNNRYKTKPMRRRKREK